VVFVVEEGRIEGINIMLHEEDSRARCVPPRDHHPVSVFTVRAETQEGFGGMGRWMG